MVTLTLTDEQVMELALRLSSERKRILAALLAEPETHAESPLVEKEGILVVSAPLTEDITDFVEQLREERIQELIAGIQP